MVKIKSVNLTWRALVVVVCSGIWINCFADASSSSQVISGADCNAIADQTSDDPQVKQILNQTKILCAQKQLADVRNQVDSIKNQQLISTLNAIGNIPGMSGAIAQPDKADHIGALLGQRTLYAAVLQVHQQLGNIIKKCDKTGAYVLLTDPEVMKERLVVVSSMSRLKLMTEAMAKLKGLAESTPVITPAKPVEKAQTVRGVPLVQLLTVLPSLVSAAEGIAGALKTESALSGLTWTPNPEVIVAGLTGSSNTNLVVPAYRVSIDGASNIFLKTYKEAFAAYSALKPIPAAMQSNLDALKTGQRASPQYTDLKKRIEDQLAQFESLDKSYNDIPTGAKTSHFDDLAVAASSLDPSASGTLLVTAAQFGGNGGTIKSKWSDDHLIYDVSVSVSYTLVDNDGYVQKAGVVFCGNTFSTTIKSLSKDLHNLLSGPVACEPSGMAN